MDTEIYMDSLRGNAKLNDDIMRQFVKLRNEYDQVNKKYESLKNDHSVITKSLSEKTEKLRQLKDEYEFRENANRTITRVKNLQDHPLQHTWVIGGLYAFTVVLLIVLSFIVKEGPLLTDTYDLDYVK